MWLQKPTKSDTWKRSEAKKKSLRSETLYTKHYEILILIIAFDKQTCLVIFTTCLVGIKISKTPLFWLLHIFWGVNFLQFQFHAFQQFVHIVQYMPSPIWTQKIYNENNATHGKRLKKSQQSLTTNRQQRVIGLSILLVIFN